MAKKRLLTDLQNLQATFQESKLDIERPKSQFPELTVTADDRLDTIILAPLFDVHVGNHQFDEKLFKKHVQWISRYSERL